MSEAGPEIDRWRGEVLDVYPSFFEAILWNLGEDAGDNRQALIQNAMVTAEDLDKIQRGAVFECETVIPAPAGEPIAREIVFQIPRSLRINNGH